METKAAVHPHKAVGAALPLWMLALATLMFASGAVMTLIWSPKAMILALALGLMAVLARVMFVRVKAAAQVRAQAGQAVANTGLAVATVVVAPLLAFALLWTGLLLILGVTWVLHTVGF